MSIIEQMKEELQNMSAEDRQALREALAEPKAEPEVHLIGQPLRNPRYVKANGEYMTAEERWDADHPLTGLWVYGEYSLIQQWGQPAKKHYYTRKEVSEHNLEVIDNWYEAKRKVFPDCAKPEIPIRYK